MALFDFLLRRLTDDNQRLRDLLQARCDRIDKNLASIQRSMTQMAGQVKDLDTVLGRIEDATTKLGTDLKQVFEAIKNNPQDLTAQVARGTAIADALIQTDADALAQANPIPVPGPAPGPPPIP